MTLCLGSISASVRPSFLPYRNLPKRCSRDWRSAWTTCTRDCCGNARESPNGGGGGGLLVITFSEPDARFAKRANRGNKAKKEDAQSELVHVHYQGRHHHHQQPPRSECEHNAIICPGTALLCLASSPSKSPTTDVLASWPRGVGGNNNVLAITWKWRGMVILFRFIFNKQ